MTTLICDFQSIVGKKIKGYATLTAGQTRPAYDAPSVVVHDPIEKEVVEGRAVFENVNPGDAVITVDWEDQSSTIRFVVPNSEEDVYLSDCITGDYFTPEEIDLLRWGIKEQISGARELIESTANEGMDGITGSIADYFTQAAETYRQTLEAASKAEEALGTIDEKVKNTEAVIPALEQTVTDLTELKSRVQEGAGKIVNAFDILDVLQGLTDTALAEAGAAKTGTQTLADEHAATLEEIERIQADISTATSETSALSESLSQQATTTATKIQDVVDALADSNTTYEEGLTRFAEAESQMQTLSYQYADAIERVGQANQKLEEQSTQLVNLAATAQTAYDALPGLRSDISTLTGDLSTATGGLSEKTDDLLGKVSALDSLTKQQGTAITSAKQTADKGVSDAATALSKANTVNTRVTTEVGTLNTKLATAKTEAANAATAAQTAAEKYAKEKSEADKAAAEVVAAAEALRVAKAEAAAAKTAASSDATAKANAAERLAKLHAEAQAKAAKEAAEATAAADATAKANKAKTDADAEAKRLDAIVKAVADKAQADASKGISAAASAKSRADKAVSDAATAQAQADKAVADAKTAADKLPDLTVGVTNAAAAAKAANDALPAIRSDVSTAQSTANTARSEATSKSEAARTAAETKATQLANAAQAAAEQTSQAALNNLQIGGRNLVRDSAFVVDRLGSALGSRREYYAHPITGEYDNLKDGDIVTISFDMEMVVGTSPVRLQVYNTNVRGPLRFMDAVKNYYDVTVGETLKTRVELQSRVVEHPEESRNRTSNFIEFYTIYDTNNFYKITNLKVERGNRATDWTPAPEDADAAIQAAQSAADEAKADAVNKAAAAQLAAEKYAKEKSEADKAAAETAAAAEALRVAKAEAAAAKKAAATDAQTKAAAAEAAAKTYAAAQAKAAKEGAEATAAADAKAKADKARTDAEAKAKTLADAAKSAAATALSTYKDLNDPKVSKAQQDATKGISDAADAQTAINAMVPGGQNVIAKSNDFDKFSPSSGWTREIVDTNVAVPEWGATDATHLRFTATSANAATYITTPSLGIGFNVEATYSVFMKNVGSRRIYRTNNGLLSTDSSTKTSSAYLDPGVAERYIAVGKMRHNYDWFQPQLRYDPHTGVAAGDVYEVIMWRSQLQAGNTATEWQPSPKDTQAEINALVTKADDLTTGLSKAATQKQYNDLNTRLWGGQGEINKLQGEINENNSAFQTWQTEINQKRTRWENGATLAINHLTNFATEQAKWNKASTDATNALKNAATAQNAVNKANQDFQAYQLEVNARRDIWETASTDATKALADLAIEQGKVLNIQTELQQKRDKWESGATLAINHLTNFTTRQTKWNKASEEATKALEDVAKAQSDINANNTAFQTWQTAINAQRTKWENGATLALEHLGNFATEQAKWNKASEDATEALRQYTANQTKWTQGANLAINNLQTTSTKFKQWTKAATDAIAAGELADKAQDNAINALTEIIGSEGDNGQDGSLTQRISTLEMDTPIHIANLRKEISDNTQMVWHKHQWVRNNNLNIPNSKYFSVSGSSYSFKITAVGNWVGEFMFTAVASTGETIMDWRGVTPSAREWTINKPTGFSGVWDRAILDYSVTPGEAVNLTRRITSKTELVAGGYRTLWQHTVPVTAPINASLNVGWHAATFDYSYGIRIRAGSGTILAEDGPRAGVGPRTVLGNGYRNMHRSVSNRAVTAGTTIYFEAYVSTGGVDQRTVRDFTANIDYIK